MRDGKIHEPGSVPFSGSRAGLSIEERASKLDSLSIALFRRSKVRKREKLRRVTRLTAAVENVGISEELRSHTRCVGGPSQQN